MKKILAFIISMAVGGAAVWFAMEHRNDILKTVRGWLDDLAGDEKSDERESVPSDDGAVRDSDPMGVGEKQPKAE